MFEHVWCDVCMHRMYIFAMRRRMAFVALGNVVAVVVPAPSADALPGNVRQ